ncbi:Hypothetical predicted protein, partial [Paramuricea clavata]
PKYFQKTCIELCRYLYMQVWYKALMVFLNMIYITEWQVQSFLIKGTENKKASNVSTKREETRNMTFPANNVAVKVHQLNQIFVSSEVVDKLHSNTLQKNNNIDKRNEQGNHGNSMFLTEIETSEVFEIISQLKPNKSHGYDGIHPKVVKELAPQISNVLCHLLNVTLETGDEETNAIESTFEIVDPDSRGIKRGISDARSVLND